MLLRSDVDGDPEVFGGGAPLIRSDALVRLDIAETSPPALIAFGSRDVDRFNNSQSTELVRFLTSNSGTCRPRMARSTALTDTLDLLAESDSDFCATLQQWDRWLVSEKQYSDHTIVAYQRDLSQFLGFLCHHLGSVPQLSDMRNLRTADFRAWLASLANSGLKRTSVAKSPVGCA
ncbi:MAG: DUF484 family protein [Alphaproteobacteria bacterium]